MNIFVIHVMLVALTAAGCQDGVGEDVLSLRGHKRGGISLSDADGMARDGMWSDATGKGRNDGFAADPEDDDVDSDDIDRTGALGPEANDPNGVRVALLYYCSKKTSANLGTTASVTGVSYKMFNLSGMVVAEDADAARAGERKASIISGKAGLLNMSAALPDGEYYVALCDQAQHAACGFTPEKRSNPLDIHGGKGLQGVIGYVSSVQFSGGKVVSATRGQALLARPTTPEEEERCDSIESPLVIDMSGKGFEFSSVTKGVSFDIDGDGMKEQVAWTQSKNNALLAYDLNGNGKVDSGLELFGNNSIGPDGKTSANGFLALAKYDANGDGFLDARDPIFAKLWLWRDLNYDGVGERHEMVDIKQAGVLTIKLSFRDVLERDSFGNEIRQRSWVTFRKNGVEWSTSIVDAWLKRTFSVSENDPLKAALFRRLPGVHPLPWGRSVPVRRIAQYFRRLKENS